MISCHDCVSIFKKHLPEGVEVNVVSRESFIEQARNNFFIQYQIGMGIYDAETFQYDFASCAVSYSTLNQMDFCYDMLCLQAEGIDDNLVRAFVSYVALHEAHHFQTNCVPRSVKEQADAEHECIADVDTLFPDLAIKAREFEAESPVFQRLLARVQALV